MWLLYLIAGVEWFTTLAVEITALRLAAPVVGSSSITTSVFLWVILLALSLWYRYGWYLASRLDKSRIRLYVGWYLLFSACWYVWISFVFEAALLQWFLDMTGQYILTLFAVSFLLFFLPVFVASQTVPLLTELIDGDSKGQAVGKMLFASTIWSFLGSVWTSIFLFQYLGVFGTWIFVCVLLLLCVVLWRRKSHPKLAWLCVWCIAVCGAWYAIFVWWSFVYSFDSAYQSIRIVDGYERNGRSIRVFKTNDAFASAIYLDDKTSPFLYVQEAIKQTIALAPKRILVIWAAGFSYPYEVWNWLWDIEVIDVIDVDPSVKKVAEEYFLEQKLHPKINFIPLSARYVVYDKLSAGVTYDLIFIDAFNGKAIPWELTTLEFFQDIALLIPDGELLVNAIMDKNLTSDLAQNILTTLEEVFGSTWYKQASTDVSAAVQNYLVSTKKFDQSYLLSTPSWSVYTDNRHSTEIDTIRLYW